jgi:hypothetical protein
MQHPLLLPWSLLIDVPVVLNIMLKDSILRIDVFDIIGETESLKRDI